MIRSTKEESVTLSHLLNRVARQYSAHVVANLQEERWLDSVRPVHLATMLHLVGDGERITTVAEELDVSKQAVKRVVDELEELKLVVRTADPSDRRAKIVRLTDDGRKACESGRHALENFEHRYRQDVGDDAVKQLWSSLLTLSDWLEHMEGTQAKPRRSA